MAIKFNRVDDPRIGEKHRVETEDVSGIRWRRIIKISLIALTVISLIFVIYLIRASRVVIPIEVKVNSRFLDTPIGGTVELRFKNWNLKPLPRGMKRNDPIALREYAVAYIHPFSDELDYLLLDAAQKSQLANVNVSASAPKGKDKPALIEEALARLKIAAARSKARVKKAQVDWHWANKVRINSLNEYKKAKRLYDLNAFHYAALASKKEAFEKAKQALRVANENLRVAMDLHKIEGKETETYKRRYDELIRSARVTAEKNATAIANARASQARAKGELDRLWQMYPLLPDGQGKRVFPIYVEHASKVMTIYKKTGDIVKKRENVLEVYRKGSKRIRGFAPIGDRLEIVDTMGRLRRDREFLATCFIEGIDETIRAKVVKADDQVKTLFVPGSGGEKVKELVIPLDFELLDSDQLKRIPPRTYGTAVLNPRDVEPPKDLDKHALGKR